MPTTPAARPSVLVDQVDRIHADEDVEHRDEDRGRLVEREDLVRQAHPVHAHPVEHGDARSKHLTRDLGHPRQVDRVVDRPDHADHQRCQEDAQGIARDRGMTPQEGHVGSQEEGRAHPDQHGHPAQIGRRGSVDVAFAYRGHRTGPDGDPSTQAREQIGRGKCGQHHQEVLAHGAAQSCPEPDPAAASAELSGVPEASGPGWGIR